jgi:hypothetical protein
MMMMMMIIIIIIIIISYFLVSCHISFLLGTSPLYPSVIPTAQASSFRCSTFRFMPNVSSTDVLCSEYIECFPGVASKFV